MKPCCQETFRKAIEEVIYLIKTKKNMTMVHLLDTLEYSAQMLKIKEQEDERLKGDNSTAN